MNFIEGFGLGISYLMGALITGMGLRILGFFIRKGFHSVVMDTMESLGNIRADFWSWLFGTFLRGGILTGILAIVTLIKYFDAALLGICLGYFLSFATVCVLRFRQIN